MLPTSRILSVGALAAALTAALTVPLGLVVAPGAQAAPRPTCHGLRATLVGTARDDRLVGGPGRDVIVGLGGDDRVDGRGGDDVICGGDGADTLRGGPGDDRLESGRQDRVTSRDGILGHPDELEGGPGDDVLVLDADPRPVGADLDAFSRITYRHSRKAVRVSLGNGRRGTARGDGRDTIIAHEVVQLVGSAHDDRLEGGPGRDVILGGTGNDVVRGLGGDDTLSGDPLTITGPLPQERDQVFGGDGDDDLTAHTGADVLHGDAGDDRVMGYSDQPSQVFGDDGDDLLATVLLTGLGIDGGAGTDSAVLQRPLGGAPASTEPVVVHTRRGTITQGALSGTAVGVESYQAEYGLTLQYDDTP